jgi:hypothetical protein
MLWNQELEIKHLRKWVGIDEPVVEVFSNDPRLADLAGWNPKADDSVAV